MTASTTVPLGKDTMSSGLRSAENYHRWTFEWIREHVRGRILDIGGGTANHLLHLADRPVVSIDLSEEAVQELRERFRARPNWQFEAGDITTPALVDKLGPATFDTVLSCNVFEHIPDDAAAFRQAHALLKQGGALVLVLPAHQALFGDMDRLAGHFRRYDQAMVRDLMQQAGFTVERLRYVNVVGAIGWFVNNRLGSHDDLSSNTINGQIGVFDKLLVPVLRRLEGNRSMPFGQSLVCVGRKGVP
jgi:SAM-dependent methyltransferase